MTTVPISAETSPSVVLELIYRLKVKDAMSSPVITAGPGASLREVQDLMRDKAITGVPIEADGRLVGMVSTGDILKAFEAGTIDKPAAQGMVSSLVTLDEEMPLSFAVTYFDRYKFGRFPVLDNTGRLSGIVTASDILRRLLIAMNEEIGRMEEDMTAKQRTAPGPLPLVELSFGTAPLDFGKAGSISQRFKKALTDKGCPPQIARKVAVASYELELNQVIHSKGGIMRMRLFDDCIEILAQDEGPGMADVELAMKEGYSTANEWVRSLGFGAGMGLPNAKRVSDRFAINSEPGKGTTVLATILWDHPR